MEIKLIKAMNNNLTEVVIGKLTLWFSYQTVIGFYTPDTGIIASENIWSNTTGRHLNSFSDKDQRIDRQLFQEQLDQVVENICKYM